MSIQDPTISVLILTYNRPAPLRRAVLSVLKSTLLPCEIVIVDNASSEVFDLEDLNDVGIPIRLIRLHKNFGCPTGRNIGVANCRGDLIYFLDDDGYLDQHALSVSVSTFLRLSESSSIAAIVSHVEMVSDEKMAGKYQAPRGDQITRKKNFSGGASLISRSSFQEAGGFPDDFWGYGEEFDLSLRMYQLGYKIYQEPQSIMFHDPLPEVGRINTNFVYYNLRNVLLTVLRHYPIMVILPFIAWYLFRWSKVALSLRRPQLILLSLLSLILKVNGKPTNLKRLTFKQLKTFHEIN